MKKELNKWQFHFRFAPDYQYTDRDFRIFEIGLVSFTSFPEQGEMIQKKHHKGWIFKCRVQFPLTRLEFY